jgi:ribonuclease BN (tRNA processing enzyme)
VYVEIHGARGSMPVGSPEFGGYGGDTTCYSVHHDDGSLVAIVDAGTGLRLLNERIDLPGTTVTFLMTHYHWDHIQGLSMCPPMWRRDISLRLVGPGDPRAGVAPAIAPPWFPVAISDVDVEFLPAPDRFELEGVTITTFPLHHPQGGLGYRFDQDGQSLVVATDHEAGGGADDRLVEVAAGTDLLICDAQYLPAEIEDKHGWGHSTWWQAADLARRADAGRLVLASHDPGRSDDQLDDIVTVSSGQFPETTAARSRSRIDLGA